MRVVLEHNKEDAADARTFTNMESIRNIDNYSYWAVLVVLKRKAIACKEG